MRIGHASARASASSQRQHRSTRPATTRGGSVAAAASGKRPSANNKAGKLPPTVRPIADGGGALSDRERALLDVAVRESQQSQQGAAAAAAPAPKAKKAKGFGAPAMGASESSAAPSSSSPSSPPVARRVDPREAARGRVELVNVRSWGGDRGAEAGDLEVVSVRTLIGGGGGGGGGLQQRQQQQQDGAAEADEAGGQEAAAVVPPLHVALAQQLQLAQARGALSIASSSGPPLAPFERWSFSPRSYAQYLADHAEAHGALDDAVDGAAAAAAAAEGTAVAAAEGAAATAAACKAASALRWLSRARGIARGDAYQSDLRAMLAGEEGGGQGAEAPRPSNGAAALARLLRRLGRDAAAGGDDGEEAALKLAAHAYALRAAHLSGSGRITAAAEGRLGLAQRGALAAVARYERQRRSGEPDAAALPSPPAAFAADFDAYGREMMRTVAGGASAGNGGGGGIIAADPDAAYAWAAPLFAELPAAFRKASALLDALAVAEE